MVFTWTAQLQPHHSHFILRNIRSNPNTQCNCQKWEESESESESGLKFIRKKKVLSDLSTWGIGGPCNYFTQVFNQPQLLSALRFCHKHSLKFMVIGKGSNCLFDDKGFDGCVILNRMEFLDWIEPGLVRVGSGFRFNSLGLQSALEGFTGLEFAAGIPGTVGGAVYMNAGANGQETAYSVDNVEIVTTKGEIQTLSRSELSFGYRSSPFQDMNNLAAITAVTFRLKRSDSARRRQVEYLERRRASQPVGQKSAGSVFRNPPKLGVSAAELIEQAGLKGSTVGGAMISQIHANFFINCGGSTSKDMLQLIGFVKETVCNKFGVELKEEVLYVDHEFIL